MDLKKGIWYIEEAQGYVQTCSSFMFCFHDCKKYWGLGYDHSYIFFNEDYFYEVTSKKDKDKLRKKLLSLFEEDKKWDLIFNDFYKLRNELWSFTKKQNKDLVNYYQRLMFLFEEILNIAVIPEAFDKFTDEELPKIIKKRYNTHDEILKTLYLPNFLSFIKEEELSLLECALGKKDIRQHTEEYFWIENSFKIGKKLSINYFQKKVDNIKKEFDNVSILKKINEIKSLVKNNEEKKNFIIKKYHISEEDIKLSKIIVNLTKLQDERKKNFMYMNYYILKLIKKISLKTNVKYDELLYYTKFEILNLLNKNKKTDVSKRKKFFCVYYGKNGFKIFNGAKNRFDNINLGKRELKGFVASSHNNKIEGVARIILNPYKNNFKENEILVTSMTRPEFFPLMKKAKAIITNEGGLTSHAAIVSRELNIPCVIGTKTATNILKDRDKVNINLKTGEIKVIK